MGRQNMNGDERILYLPLKKEWYDMIESGEKTEEYREIKPYWCNRLLYGCTLGVKEYWEGVLQNAIKWVAEHGKRIPSINMHNCLIRDYGIRYYTHVCFSYGYTKKRMIFEYKNLRVGYGKTEWGAPANMEVFIIELGKRIN